MAFTSSNSALKRLTPWLSIAAIIIVIDQLTKFAAEHAFRFGQRRHVLPFFDLTLLYNKGAAFSFLAGASGWQRHFFTIVGIVAALGIIYLLIRHGQQRLFCWALTLILAGAIGNVIDRLWHGQVIDFLLFYYRQWYWPAFNVADAAIVVGAGLLVLDELRRVRKAH